MYLITNHTESKTVTSLTKDHLWECKNDSLCLIFNLMTLEYFNPKKNKWFKVDSK